MISVVAERRALNQRGAVGGAEVRLAQCCRAYNWHLPHYDDLKDCRVIRPVVLICSTNLFDK